MTRKASNVVSMPDSAATVQPATEAKIAYNRRFGDESVTIRTATVEELVTLRDQLSEALPALATVQQQAHNGPYFTEGDACPRDTCDGKLYLRSRSRGNFFGCNRYPRYRFTSRA